MPLFVWGKYNGWYRVETHDHIFGWVKTDYLSSPALAKIREMSSAKARAASQRTSHLVMFGTPNELRDYYARTGAEGARKGLMLHGVRMPLAQTKPSRIRVAEAKSRVATTNAPRLVSRALNRRSPAMMPVKPFPAAPESIAPASSERVVAASQNASAARDSLRLAALSPVAQSQTSVATNRMNAPAPRRLSRSQMRQQKRAAVLRAKRERLRAKTGFAKTPKAAMPIVPSPIAVAPVAPISPRELLKARENFLQERRNANTLGGNPSAPLEATPAPRDAGSSPETPTPALVPSSLSSDKLAPGSVISVAYPTQIEGRPALPPRISWVDEGGKVVSATMPLLPAASSKIAAQHLAALNDELVQPFVVSHAQLTPTPKPQAQTGYRGGSVLDRYRKPNAFGQGVTNQALSYRGMPYIFGAANPRRGFDCSGLVFYLLRSRGLNPPRTAAGYRNFGQPVSRENLQSGDLVLFANTYKHGISHIGIYMGNNKFVHAASTGKGVRVDSLTTGYFAKKYHSARRVK